MHHNSERTWKIYLYQILEYIEDNAYAYYHNNTQPLATQHANLDNSPHILTMTLLLLIGMLVTSMGFAILSMYFYLPVIGIVTGSIVPLLFIVAIYNIDTLVACHVLLFLFAAFTGYSLCPLLIINAHLSTSLLGYSLIELGVFYTALIIGVIRYGDIEGKDFYELNPRIFAFSVACIVLPIINLLLLRIPIFSLCIALIMIIINTCLLMSEISSIRRGAQTSSTYAALSLYIRLIDIFIPFFSIKLGLYCPLRELYRIPMETTEGFFRYFTPSDTLAAHIYTGAKHHMPPTAHTSPQVPVSTLPAGPKTS